MERVSVFRSHLVKEEGMTFKPVHATSGEHVAKFFRNIYQEGTIGVKERMYALYLNNALETVAFQLLGEGSITACIVDIRLLCKGALDNLAVRVVLCHNHPSGNLKPSPSDLKLTEKCKKALDVFDITLLDHIILTEDGFYSFANEGKL